MSGPPLPLNSVDKKSTNTIKLQNGDRTDTNLKETKILNIINQGNNAISAFIALNPAISP